MYFYYSFSPVKIARLVARDGFTNFHTRCDDIRVIILNDCTHLYTDCVQLINRPRGEGGYIRNRVNIMGEGRLLVSMQMGRRESSRFVSCRTRVQARKTDNALRELSGFLLRKDKLSGKYSRGILGGWTCYIYGVVFVFDYLERGYEFEDYELKLCEKGDETMEK